MKIYTRGAALAVALVLVGAACSDDSSETSTDESTTTTVAASDETTESASEAGTIVEVADEAGSFTTLLAAAEAADLVDTLNGEGPFTVFAPTDEAFAAALEALDLTADELLASDDLAGILTYHVVPGNVPAADVLGLDGQSVATVNGAEVTITIDGDTVMVDDATVTATDIAASNGVIHIIDMVLLPGTFEAEEAMEDEAMEDESPGTIVEVADEAGSFTTLLAAAEAADLVDTLNGEGPFTVFAPTDEAFAAALEALDLTADELLASDDLAGILTYHVVPGNVPAADVLGLDGQSVATVNGAEVTITIDGDTVMVDDATVTATDIAASNGVIHIIDMVLLP